jgi:filamentous hemagglutinin family protein
MYGELHLREGRLEFRWKRWRNKKRQEMSSCLMVLLSGAILLGGGGIAEAGPTGGQITSGQGSIAYGGATTVINQRSQVIDINWQTFSTGPMETVDFNQPNSSSLAINFVIGGVPSVLQGALNATGRVYILNSAGITFTGTSHVNVGALLATTAMTVDGDPTQSLDFTASGSGQVINHGSIRVSEGGFAILAAPYVENTGFIKADLGTIALAGTNRFTLDLRGDGLINFVVPPDAVEKIRQDGNRIGVNNSGTLQARSGQVLISASVATQVVNAVVNMSGVVDASAYAPNGQGGAVLVTSAGDVNIGGQVSAAGAGSGAGGQIVTQAVGADNIAKTAVLTAAGGKNGQGGEIEVGGHKVRLSGALDPGAGGTPWSIPSTSPSLPSTASTTSPAPR